MARPQKTATLTAAQIEKLAAMGCADDEIAVLAGFSEATLQRDFEAHLKKGRAELRKRIRRKQLERMNAGSDAMTIWLGKVYLGQREQQDVQHGGDVTIRIVYEDSDPAAPASDAAGDPAGRPPV